MQLSMILILILEYSARASRILDYGPLIFGEGKQSVNLLAHWHTVGRTLELTNQRKLDGLTLIRY